MRALRCRSLGVWGRTKLSLSSFKVFAPKSSVFGAYHLIFAGKIGPVSFTFFTEHVRLALFGDFAVRRFESEFALYGVNKTQTADGDRFRPPTFSATISRLIALSTQSRCAF